MRVEELFRMVDSIIGLNEISNLIVIPVSAILVFVLSLGLFLSINKHNKVQQKENLRVKDYYLILLLLTTSLAFLLYGLIESISQLTITNVLIVGFLIYIATLTYIFLVSSINKQSFSILFLFYLSTLLFVTPFSSKPLINGVDTIEATTDVLQIWYDKHFSFSRHAGWYDFAPVNAITKNFLLNILGINSPYDPSITSMIYISLSISYILALFAFLERMCCKNLKYYALAVLCSASNSYAILLNMSGPPVNYSLTLGMISVFLVTIMIYKNDVEYTHRLYIPFSLITLTSILAHPTGILIPLYIMSAIFYLFINKRYKAKELFYLLLISFLMIALKALYTGLNEGLSTLLNILLTAFRELLSGDLRSDIKVFYGSPEAPPKSILVSYVALPAMLTAILIVETIKKLRKNSRVNTFILFIISVIIPLIFIGFIINLVISYSRYFAVSAIALGGFVMLLYMSEFKNIKFYKLEKTLFIVLIFLGVLISVLSPNALTEQYNLFTGGRWPRIENFILAKFLFDHIDLNYVTAVFYGVEKPKLTLYLSNDILLYGHPYHQIECLIVERLLIPGIINTRSYWDFYWGRLFLTYKIGYEFDALSENVILNAWKWVAAWK